MDEKEKQNPPEPGYVPRPWWQVAGAWLGLILFLGSIVLLYLYARSLG